MNDFLGQALREPVGPDRFPESCRPGEIGRSDGLTAAVL
jgi:hypothetical protein